MTVQPTESILIVDFGSQVTQLIARRVREAGVYSEIAPFNSAEEAFDRLKPKGIILSGGPASVTEAESPRAPQVIFDSGLPILAICYGQQTLHQQLGGKVVTVRPEASSAAPSSRSCRPRALFDGLWTCRREASGLDEPRRPGRERCAPGFEVVARSEGAPFAIATDEEREALQPHVPPGGRPHARRRQAAVQLRPPCLRPAPATGRWPSSATTKIADIREQVGNGPRHLRPVRRRRQRRRGGSHPRSDRRAADLRVRRPRPDAGRARPSRSFRLFRNSYNIPLVHVDASRDVPRRPRRRHRPREEAQVHRQDLHRRVRGRGEEDRRRRLPRAGHALSRT